MTDPDGTTTSYSYDEAGQQTVTTDPPVTTETGGGAPWSRAAGHHDRVRHVRRGRRDQGRRTATSRPTPTTPTAGRSPRPCRPTPRPAPPARSAARRRPYNSARPGHQPDRPARQHHHVHLRPARRPVPADRPRTPASPPHLRHRRRAAVGDRADRRAEHRRPTTILGRQLTATQVERYPVRHRRLHHHDLLCAHAGGPGRAWQSSVTVPGRGEPPVTRTTRPGRPRRSPTGPATSPGYSYDALGRQTATVNPDGTSRHRDLRPGREPGRPGAASTPPGTP